MLTGRWKTRALAASLALTAIAGALLTSAQPAQALDEPTNDVTLDMERLAPLAYPLGLSVFNLYGDTDWDANNPDFQMADIDAATAALTASNFFDKTAQYGVPDLTFAGSAQAKSFCPFPALPTDTGPETSSVALVAFLLCEEATPGTGVPYSFGDRIYNVIVPSTWTINDFGAKSCSSYGGYHFIIPSAPAIPFGIPPPGRPIIYTVIPAKCFEDVSGLMSMISHEVVEAATDPNPLPGGQSWIDVSTVNSISSLFAPLRWGEASDICEGRGGAVRPGDVSVTYSGIAMEVGAYWSNHDNACMVGPSRVVTATFEATGLSGFPVSVTVNGVARETPLPQPPPPLPPFNPPLLYTETLREGATYSFPDAVIDGSGRRLTHPAGACSGSIAFPAGNITADATAAITCAYAADTTPPVIAAHADEMAEATSAAGAAVSYTSPATSDAVDGAGVATCAPASGSTFAIGTTPVTCNATDTAGNAATPTSFDVTVQDTTPPVIAAHGNETAEATSAAGASVSYTSPATSDAVDGAGAATCSPASGSTFAIGTTPVTCNATDAADNAATPTSFNVTVQDTTSPLITCPPGIVGIVGQSMVLGTASAIDTVDAAPVLSNNAPAVFGPGTTNVQWTATDASGNAATCMQSVTLRYNFSGFFSPVDMPDVVNMAKAGSTIPVRWRLTDFAGGYVTDVATVVGLTSFRTNCSSSAPSDEIETTVATGGTALRYDAVAQQFVYNWATLKSWLGTCRTLVLALNDGTIHMAHFKFR